MTNEELQKEPLKSWNRNPFFRPDIRRLIDDGFLTEGPHEPEMSGAVSFTDKALEVLKSSHWFRP